MTGEDLENFKHWFSEYTRSFYSSNEEDQKNIILKVEHSRHVHENIVAIARSLPLTDNQIRIAEAVALFHDIGRFPQYVKYKTFRDADSKNHGLLGVKTLRDKKVLHALAEKERAIILDAIRFHGVYRIPTVLESDTVLFLKLIRDADKVDIYRVFIEYYESPPEDRASATAFGVPDTDEYSKEMLSSLYEKRIASYARIKTENDFRIMKLSWLYDIHFDESLRLLQKRNCIQDIIDKLPKTEEVLSAIAELTRYIEGRLEK